MDIQKTKKETARRTHLALKKQHADGKSDTGDVRTNEEKQWFTTIFMEWNPLEFREMARGDNWYLWLGVITAILITIFILTKTYIVAVTFFLVAVVLVMFAQKPSKRVRVRLTDTGIEIRDKFYPYHSLKSFWILYEPPHITTLNFEQKSKVTLNINVEIENEDPVAIRDILLQYLPEDEEKEEDIVDTIARRLRF